MATTIKLKNGSGAPLAGDLVQGEPALDLTNKRLYTEDSGGTVIEIGTSPSTIDINAGTIDGTTIGGSSAAAGTFTTFTSTGIDDNATSTAITIDSSQNVGIGTASPSEPLTIRGAVNSAQLTLGGTANRGLKISTTNPSGQNDAGVIYDAQDTEGGGYGTHQFQIAGSTKLIIDSSGNVGIGTTSIDSGVKIHVEESSASLTAATTSSVALFERAGNAGISIGTANTGESTIFFQDTDSATIGRVKYDHADDSLGFWANGSERARIDSSGNVGIGTTSPAKPLHIFTQSGGATTTPLVLQNNQTSANTAVEIRLAPSTQPNDIGSTARWSAIKAENTGTGQATELSFWTNASSTDPSERVRIDSSGNVGIGTDNPAELLHVNEASTNAARMRLSNTDGYIEFGTNNQVSNIDSQTHTFRNEAGSTEYMRINSSGNLLVGCTSQPDASNFGGFINPIGQFRSSRNSTASSTQFSFNNPNGEVGTIVTSGSATAYNTSSDQRLKENIVDAPAGNIDAIRVRSFDWKADGSHQTYGMVAQELFDVAPEAVTQGETEDDMWGVDYSKLVPMMIKEIQDLKAEVAALKGA